MECREVRETLGAWLDRELPPDKGQVVARHLAGCESCSAERLRLERVESLLAEAVRSGAPAPPFEIFWRGVEERLRRREGWRYTLRDRFPALGWPRPAWLVPAAAAALLVALGVNYFWSAGRGGGAANNLSFVESIDAHGGNVALFRESKTRTTIIWLFNDPTADDESAEEKAEEAPSF